MASSSSTETLNERQTLGESLEDATVRLDWPFVTGGYIDFLGAGRQSATYSERVNTFDWTRFYEIGGSRILQSAKQHMRELYDWVLIDSRTGVSDTSGVCTIQMPDAVVPCFTLNRQSIEGVVAIMRSIRSFRSESLAGDKIKFYPIATRIENAEQARLEAARGYARSLMAEFLPKDLRLKHARDYWDGMEITYRPAYAFEEVLAAFGDATGAAGAADTMLSQVEAVAHRITGDSSMQMPEIVEVDRNRVLAKYALEKKGDGIDLDDKLGDDRKQTRRPNDARQANVDYSTESEIDTEFRRRVLAKEQSWRASEYRWWFLLSQREIDLLTEHDRKSFGRSVTYFVVQSEALAAYMSAATSGFSKSLALTLAATIALLGSTSMNTNKWLELIFEKPLLLVVLPCLAILFWVISCLIFSAVQRSRDDTPYGLRMRDAFKMTLLGPFKPQVLDYEPEIGRS